MPLCNFRQKLLIQLVILPIGYFLGLEQKGNLMNYRLRENLMSHDISVCDYTLDKIYNEP